MNSYRVLSRNAIIEDATINLDVNYIVFGLGIVKTF